MNIYLARLTKKYGYTPIGVFQARSLGELWELVDAAGDPNITEYAVLPRGASIAIQTPQSGDKIPEDGVLEGGYMAAEGRAFYWSQLDGCDPVELHWLPIPDIEELLP
jgi:hypothetical protein